MHALLALPLLLLVSHAAAYIPAVPTNDTTLPVFNASSLSNIQVRWQQPGNQPMGGYSTAVSYQLAGEDSNGVTQGAIVHFTEATAADNLTTTTPWIAFISCDANATDASMEDDIFTLAQERGAISALLYSQYSQACLINAEYLSPEFDKLIDVFATTSAKTAGLIESQFEQVNSTFYYYDAALLNASALLVNESLADLTAGTPTYLVAELHASNATGNATTPSTGTTTSGSSTSSSPPNTGLAMIILYAITGCVSVLFCVVILSGAIRAIRHPERYGPRADPGYLGGPPPQTRTAGLARAILDTFPVIKFASGGGRTTPRPGSSHYRTTRFSAGQFSPPDTSLLADVELAPALQLSRSVSASGSRLPSPTASSSTPPRRAPTPLPGNVPPPQSSDPSLGHETCPICLTPFEEGDEVRVLPCNGQHRFHKDCVDPWLLQLATSCPLCREDFALQEEEEHGREGDYLELPVPVTPPPPRRPALVDVAGSAGRLSRALFGGRRPSSTLEDRERDPARERERRREMELEMRMVEHEQALPHPLA
ncbi:hypothetical protein CALVIDRAFT_515779 [Calocera viscosa TUFC12733]|uniref:RING-type domain-containing protein n=1 Tax=Calocera viscosa (strain TUFC12733) TaxID=1330018 RepID=A0A167LB83_CALVF|nr:hypothetical protein CALVIDRAFT_515779 [Calocera viscosa TUFC12733]